MKVGSGWITTKNDPSPKEEILVSPGGAVCLKKTDMHFRCRKGLGDNCNRTQYICQ